MLQKSVYIIMLPYKCYTLISYEVKIQEFSYSLSGDKDVIKFFTRYSLIGNICDFYQPPMSSPIPIPTIPLQAYTVHPMAKLHMFQQTMVLAVRLQITYHL